MTCSVPSWGKVESAYDRCPSRPIQHELLYSRAGLAPAGTVTVGTIQVASTSVNIRPSRAVMEAPDQFRLDCWRGSIGTAPSVAKLESASYSRSPFTKVNGGENMSVQNW